VFFSVNSHFVPAINAVGSVQQCFLQSKVSNLQMVKI